ncbi:MAG: hypothetical protein ACTSPB_19100, partial [Candidatus Thorarchaeota archaeon]
IEVEKTAGTQTLKLYWKMYERKADDSEVLIATSTESNEIDSRGSLIIPLNLTSDYVPASNSRIVGKFYASVSGGGNAPTVRIYCLGDTGSRCEIPANSEVFRSIFVPYDNAVQDVDLGSYTLTAPTVKLSNLTNGYIPYHVSDAGGLADSPIRADGNRVAIGNSVQDHLLYLDYAPTNSASAHGLTIKYTPKITSTMDNYSKGLFVDAKTDIASGVTNTGYHIAIHGQVFHNSDGDLDDLRGLQLSYGNYTGGNPTRSVTNTYGIRLRPYIIEGTITNLYDIFIGTTATGGTVTNHWGIYQQEANDNYFAGNLGIRTTNPQANVEIEDGGTSNSVLLKITQDDNNPYALVIGNDTYSTTDTLGLVFRLDNNGHAFVQNYAEGDLYLRGVGTVNASRILIDAEDKICFRDYNEDSPSTKITMDMQNGNLGIGTTDQFGSGAGVLTIANAGTNPTTNPTDATILFSKDYDDGDATATSELFVRDEDGNETNLSPHAFEIYQPDPDDPFPWTYHSVSNLIGKKINVDMSGAIRELERLSGKSFIYIEDVERMPIREHLERKKKYLIEKYQKENESEIEVSLSDAVEIVETEVEDYEDIVVEEIKYCFEDGKIKEVKTPIYRKKKMTSKQLKEGIRLDEKTGKLYKKVQPSREEAEAAIKDGPKLKVRKWIQKRL